jgi:hypothetical protein
LEILHWLATKGEIDDVVSRMRFGRYAKLAVLALIRMGHPIEPIPVTRKGWHRRWAWIPLKQT